MQNQSSHVWSNWSNFSFITKNFGCILCKYVGKKFIKWDNKFCFILVRKSMWNAQTFLLFVFSASIFIIFKNALTMDVKLQYDIFDTKRQNINSLIRDIKTISVKILWCYCKMYNACHFKWFEKCRLMSLQKSCEIL